MNQQFDRPTLFAVIALITIGLMAVYSSTSVLMPDGKVGQFHYLKRQLFTLALGIIVMIAAYKINLQFIRKMAVPLLILSFIGLLLVFTSMGMSANGARRWLRLLSFSFQPSELAKLAMIVFLAWYMSKEAFKKDSFVWFIIPIGIMVIFQAVFLLQPDFGATVSLAILTISMLLLGGVRLRFIGGMSFAALIAFAALLITKPYRVKRFTAFLDPWEDPLGSGFQLIQSYIAFGSGGLMGVGIGESKQKLAFLPEVHTDFIFSMIGEEAGFIAALMVILLFFLLFYRGIVIAGKTKDLFAYFVACGTVMMITIQAIINFSVATGLAPTKGLPLPFISYGGSSLIVSMAAIGLLLNVSRCQEQLAFTQEEYKTNDKDIDCQPNDSNHVRRWQRGFGYNHCRKTRFNRESLQ